MYLGDFHLHTDYSDGKLGLRELVDLFGKSGFGAISVTDHLCENGTFLGKAAHYLRCTLRKDNFAEYISRVEEEGERAWRLYRMRVMPGFEITKNTFSNRRSSHMLAIGARKYIDPSLSVEEICRQIRAQGALAVAAHPVPARRWEKQTLYLWDRKEELKDCFDAWEAASGRILFHEVLKSGLPMLASSDLHHPKQIRSWKTLLRCERSEEAIKDSIRRQQLEFRFYEGAAGAFPEHLANAFPYLR